MKDSRPTRWSAHEAEQSHPGVAGSYSTAVYGAVVEIMVPFWGLSILWNLVFTN